MTATTSPASPNGSNGRLMRTASAVLSMSWNAIRALRSSRVGGSIRRIRPEPIPPSARKFANVTSVAPNATIPKSWGVSKRASTSVPISPIDRTPIPRSTSTAAPVTALCRTSPALSRCSSSGCESAVRSEAPCYLRQTVIDADSERSPRRRMAVRIQPAAPFNSAPSDWKEGGQLLLRAPSTIALAPAWSTGAGSRSGCAGGRRRVGTAIPSSEARFPRAFV